MDRDKCDMESAFKFVEHNQTCYEIARAVANAKDEDAKAEKQQWIDKACEWLKDNKEHPLIGCEDTGLSGFLTEEFITEFRKAMEGGEYGTTRSDRPCKE
jgi:hypothetical protein